MKPAERSSWCTWTRTRPSAASASAIGVDRDPGATTASVSPARTHSSTSVAQNVAAVVSAGSEPVTDDSLGLRVMTTSHRAADPRAAARAQAGRRSAPIRPAPRRPRSRQRSDQGRLVAVHGFTQTSACWSPDRRRAWPRPRPGAGRRPGPRRVGPASSSTCGTGADALAEAGGAGTYLGYSMGGRLCLHAALARPDQVAAPGAGQRHRRASTTPASGPAAAPPTSAGRPPDGRRRGRLRRRVAGPAAVRRPRPRDRPIGGPGWPTPPTGLASSLRLAGTGTQEPAVGPAGASWPCRCWWWPAPRPQVRGAGRAAG